MNVAAKMRQAGFSLAITKRGGLWIEPASKLTAEQRAFIKAHKVVLLEELRVDVLAPALAPATEPHSSICAEVTSPLEARIAELVADGWAIWNAQARAETEVLLASWNHSTPQPQAPIITPQTGIGLVEVPASVISAHPALPDAIPIEGARYSLWKVRFNDGGSMTLVEPEPTCFADAWRYAASLTGVVSIAPMSEPA